MHRKGEINQVGLSLVDCEFEGLLAQTMIVSGIFAKAYTPKRYLDPELYIRLTKDHKIHKE
ncbi:MAG: hypothetical protein FWE73_01360 [Candidatus Bathyarchaeota archaeon]|nr:hypothetical protein [Candidatus Termitimicrobium sp.]